MWTKKDIDEAAAATIAQELGCPLFFARILSARGIHSAGEARLFLEAPAERMYDPFLMKGMPAAVDRILQALREHEKITIYGDYDVDGMTSVSILLLFFQEHGANVSYYIPNRLREGYGMNEDAVRRIAEDGTGLIITVDTGISGNAPCALAASLGLDVIVTDHHECPPTLPQAAAVIDIKQPDETYPFHALAGCGTAFKLVQALSMRLGCPQEAMRYTELAAVGTIADIVPLVDENRLIVAEGFRRLRDPENLGVRKLLEVSGWTTGGELTGDMISFGAGPRLNACGRLGDASDGVRLLTTRDEEEAAQIAADMNAKNAQRKDIEKLILHQVIEQIEGSPSLRSSLLIVTAGEGWHHGVIGIVSSRVKDKYYRPNIVFAVENGIAVGSARSIEGFNLYKALSSCSDLMMKYGGHEAAAGLTLRAENLPLLTERLNAYAASHMTPDMLTPRLEPEITLDPSDVTMDLIRWIRRMEPFGKDMPEPLVEVRGHLGEIRRIGKDQAALRISIRDRACALQGIGFQKADYADYYLSGSPVSLAGTLQINSYMGEDSPQIMIEDMHGEMEEGFRRILQMFGLRAGSPAFKDYCRRLGRPGKDTCAKGYQFLKRYAQQHGSAQEGKLSLEYYTADCGPHAHAALVKLLMSCAVFEELGLMELEMSGPYMHYRLMEGRRARLEDSSFYCELFHG